MLNLMPSIDPAPTSFASGRALKHLFAALFAVLSVLPPPARAFTEIEIREDRDGAGPSHIFLLRDNVVAVVDPLDGAISAYRDGESAALKTTKMPAGFRPWRLSARAPRSACPGSSAPAPRPRPRTGPVRSWP